MTRPRYTANETDFRESIQGFAKLFGWMYYHTHDSRRSPEGFPDLVLVKPPRFIVAECKVGDNKPTQQQEDWLSASAACPGVETYLWYPDDWDEIERVLG